MLGSLDMHPAWKATPMNQPNDFERRPTLMKNLSQIGEKGFWLMHLEAHQQRPEKHGYQSRSPKRKVRCNRLLRPPADSINFKLYQWTIIFIRGQKCLFPFPFLCMNHVLKCKIMTTWTVTECSEYMSINFVCKVSYKKHLLYEKQIIATNIYFACNWKTYLQRVCFIPCHFNT